jgi:hypothetical protein
MDIKHIAIWDATRQGTVWKRMPVFRLYELACPPQERCLCQIPARGFLCVSVWDLLGSMCSKFG